MGKPVRVLVLVPHTGSGIVSPMIEQLRQYFDVTQVVYVQLPRILIFFLLIISFRPNRKAWYQNWQRMREKTMFSFNVLTRICEHRLADLGKDVDAVIQFGAQFSPGRFMKTIPYFIIADSTRYLSSHNQADEISIFSNRTAANKWFAQEGEVYKNASGLIARSLRVGESFKHHYGVNPKSILVRNFGVGLSHSKGDFLKHYDGKTILFVAKGNFTAKGGQVVLDAFTTVLKIVPDARLIIVGQEGESTKNIEYLGIISDRNRLRQLYEQAHVFVLPSFIERFGMSLLEAMAAYTPCIVANHAAMPEIIGDTGFTVPLGDANALADKTLMLLQNKSLSAELGRKARVRFTTELSWEAVGSDITMFIGTRVNTRTTGAENIDKHLRLADR